MVAAEVAVGDVAVPPNGVADVAEVDVAAARSGRWPTWLGSKRPLSGVVAAEVAVGDVAVPPMWRCPCG
ncbi:hypothetical protein I1A49_17840 [Streptomyces malaysiensis subsp. malaysiensis]|uniref:Uncharacterized protein n=1 Tax=Streptomyces malaysiensis TaxID=92644 RepID=A0ABX6W6A3_STRMQ|nr:MULTISPECIES: hypothetical protein [Streptomyces]QPI56543.1 hypothetical protein I1A49_17840 [Streptomyces solisilvae]UHH18039.1 hypothetical protein LUV23_17990 [Streptomyces sp. HNM0561]